MLPIAKERRVGAQVSRDFFGLALLDCGSSGKQVVVVLRRHLNSFVEGDPDRSLRLAECAVGHNCTHEHTTSDQACTMSINPTTMVQRRPPVPEASFEP